MIGYLALARDTFDINYALDKKNKFEKFINILDIKYTQFNELITNDEAGKRAINYFKKQNCTKFIIAQTTFTDAKFITSFAKIFKKPLLLISFKEPRTGKRLRLNSLCGVNLAMHSLIKLEYNPEFSIFVNDKLFEIEKINKFIKNKKNLKNNKLKKITNIKKENNLIFSKKKNLGLIGKRPEGFFTCDYDNNEIVKKLNYNLKKIKLETLFNISKKINSKDIAITKNQIKKDLKSVSKLNSSELNKSISIFHGLEKIKNENQIDAFAIKCWPEMFTQFGCASCGPMAMMNEKGVSSACEADVLGSISCDILNKINNKPSLLVDIVDCDPKTDTLVFWHCGLAPISMAKKNTASATVHSNRRKALLHNFSFKPGKITIFRVSKSENKLKFIVLRGEVLNKKNSFSGTSGVVRFEKNTYQKLVRLFSSGIEHHLAFTYGDIYSDIKKLSAQLEIPIYTA